MEDNVLWENEVGSPGGSDSKESQFGYSGSDKTASETSVDLVMDPGRDVWTFFPCSPATWFSYLSSLSFVSFLYKDKLNWRNSANRYSLNNLNFCTCSIFLHAIKIPTRPSFKNFSAVFILVFLVHLTLSVPSGLFDSLTGFCEGNCSSRTLSAVCWFTSGEKLLSQKI